MQPQTIRISCFLFLALIASVCIADHGREIRPKGWKQDATVNDIFALNDKLAWAVGDQGLILLTTDGGETWVRSVHAGLDLDNDRTLFEKLDNMRPINRTHELYPLTCTFNSVFFLNESRGWVAGYYHTPYLEQTRSVLLTTSDGGVTWSQFKANLLPQINRIHFQDLLGGWAIGRSGNLFKSGVFATSSGGRNWTVQDVKPSRNWIDGELIPNGFVVIDDEGIIGRIKGNEFEPSIVFGKRASRLNSVRMLDENIGWAVGHNGTILQTKDGGLTWKRPASLAENKRLELFDFETLFIREGKVWIAGSPGTFVVSLDARNGSNLTFQSTPISLPIKKLCFSSKTNGWAVGAQGQILATKNGGKNWETQRYAHERLAIMVASQDASDLPFGLLSYCCSENNRLSCLALLGEQSRVSQNIAQSSVNRIGCSTQLNLLGMDFEKEHDEHLNEQLLRELVRSIRMVRPNVLVCNQIPGISDHRLHVLCRTAIEMAADDKSLPDQIEKLDLENWQVDRYLIRQTSGDVVFAGSHYLPRIGKLLEDLVAVSRGLTGLPIGMATSESYQVESFTGSVTTKGNDLFFGLKQLGREIPTRQNNIRFGNLNSIATAPLKNSEIRRLVSLDASTTDQIANVHREVRRFATGIDAQETGIWLMQLAELYLDAGKMEAAAFAMEELVRRNQDHPMAPAALMWLTQYYSSAEVAATLLAVDTTRKKPQPAIMPEIPAGLRNKFVKSNASFSGDGEVQLVSWEVEVDPRSGEIENHSLDVDDTELKTDSNDGEIDDKLDKKTIQAVVDFRTQKASGFLSKLKQYDLDFAQNENVRFMEAMVLSKVPGNYSHENLLKKISRSRQREPELAAAVGRELMARKKNRNFAVPRCFYTDIRPQLDGNLDDDLWQQAIENGKALFKPMTPHGFDKSIRNDVYWLAYDEEFLFVAVRCNRLDTDNYQLSTETRQRDADLSRFDRVRLTLDFDRDLQSEFSFEVDYRGWASESCAGARGWDPNWFIAVGGDKHAWTAEFAIPLQALTPKPVREIDYAAFSISRLDSHSTNLWSTEQDRQPEKSVSGIVAGLKIKPKRFEILEFVNIEITATDANEVE